MTIARQEALSLLTQGTQPMQLAWARILPLLFDLIEGAPLYTSGTHSAVELFGDGAPDASALATIGMNPAGDDNALTFTAKTYGAAGNDITISYVDPGVALSALAVTVVGSAIRVSLETDAGSAIVTTAAEVLAAIEAAAEADALVTVVIDATDTGVADDGSGVVTALSATALEGGTGVGVGTAGIGSRYTDITNGVLYLNTGTAAQPVWAALAFVA